MSSKIDKAFNKLYELLRDSETDNPEQEACLGMVAEAKSLWEGECTKDEG